MASEETKPPSVFGPAKPPPSSSATISTSSPSSSPRSSSSSAPAAFPTKKAVYGPSLEELLKPVTNEKRSIEEEEDDYDFVGPRLPSSSSSSRGGKGEDDSDDDEVFEGAPNLKKLYPHLVTKTKEEQEEEEEKRRKQKEKREDWMVSLPKAGDNKNFDPLTAIQNRQFSRRDVSSNEDKNKGMEEWTETPQQKAERLQEEEDRKEKRRRVEGDRHHKSSKRRRDDDDDDDRPKLSKKDEESKKLLDEYNKRFRKETLYEKHQKELDKKKKKEIKKAKKKAKKEKKLKEKGKTVKSSLPDRRPFDREKDVLGPRQMNAKKLNSVLTESKGFGDRFGRTSFL